MSGFSLRALDCFLRRKVCLAGRIVVSGAGRAVPTLQLLLLQCPFRLMASISPFRALRYDPTRVSLPEVVTQPYDKITSDMQEQYHAASPFNLVRIILGKRKLTN